MEDASERRETFLQHCPSAIRIEAVDGRKMTPEDIRSHFNITQSLTRGIIGCYASHIKAWKIAQQSKTYSIICEDDFKMFSDYKERFEQLLGELPEEWDMVNLYHLDLPRFALNYIKLQGFETNRRGYSNLLDVKDFVLSSACYALSPKGASKLLNYYKTHGMVNHVDKEVNKVPLTRFISKLPFGTIENSTVCNSSTTTKRPYLLNKVFDKFNNILPDYSDAWFLSSSDLQYGPFYLNIWSGLFCLVSLFAMFFKQYVIVNTLSFYFFIDLIFSKDIRGFAADMSISKMGCFIGYCIRLLVLKI